MANKNWSYVVVYQNPVDIDLTPAKRSELSMITDSTTAARAQSKAKKIILKEWDMDARDLVILDVYRDRLYDRRSS